MVEKRCYNANFDTDAKLANIDAIIKNGQFDLYNNADVILLNEARRAKKRKQFTAQYIAFYGTGWAK
jgi:hypothetical protein